MIKSTCGPYSHLHSILEYQSGRRSFIMKIWLSKNSEIPIRDQLVTQITLGIASSDLRAGDKLPSTREMARRFAIHPNTVSAAYQALAEQHLIEFRKGSGCYVSKTPDDAAHTKTIEQLISRFVLDGAALGFGIKELSERLGRLAANGRRSYLIVESNEQLREILIAEVQDGTGCVAEGVSFEEFDVDGVGENVSVVALFDEKQKLSELVAAGIDCIFLEANSVPAKLQGQERPLENELVAVASAWEGFLTLSKLFLVAAGVHPEAIIIRPTAAPDWQRGTETASLIICDAVTAKFVDGDSRVRIFRIASESSISELKKRAGINHTADEV